MTPWECFFNRVLDRQREVPDALAAMEGRINTRLDIIMATLEDLKARIENQTTVETSVVTLLESLTAGLKQAQLNNDPAAIDAIIAQLDGNTKILSDAVIANTPAPPHNPDPTPAPTPPTGTDTTGGSSQPPANDTTSGGSQPPANDTH